MKNMAKLGNLNITNKNFTNHSIRKTTKLQQAGISNDKIVAVTGHRNKVSLKAYRSSTTNPVWDLLLQMYVLHTPHLLPHFNFCNCTVYFDGSQMHGSVKVPPVKKRKVNIIDSDSDD